MIVSFTGHRQIDEIRARENIVPILKRLNPERAIVGGAEGADMLAAEICWELQIPYLMALPHHNYARHYKLIYNERWRKTLDRSEEYFFVVENQPWHFSHNFKRNEWMVDHSDILISVSTFDPHGEIPLKGGTAHCVRYAKKVGRQIEWAQV